MLTILNSYGINVCIIIENNLTQDLLKCQNFGSIILEVFLNREEMLVVFLIVSRKVWYPNSVKSGISLHIKELKLINLTCGRRGNASKLMISTVHLVTPNLNVAFWHSPVKQSYAETSMLVVKPWNYNDLNSTGILMEDLLISDKMELLYNYSDVPNYLHYDSSSTNSDLTLASAD